MVVNDQIFGIFIALRDLKKCPKNLVNTLNLVKISQENLENRLNNLPDTLLEQLE